MLSETKIYSDFIKANESIQKKLINALKDLNKKTLN